MTQYISLIHFKDSHSSTIVFIDWSEITENMYKVKTAVEATHYVTPPILLKKLLQQNDELESIQRALEIYLESKRQLFPRFYFISNDDLLEVRS